MRIADEDIRKLARSDQYGRTGLEGGNRRFFPSKWHHLVPKNSQTSTVFLAR